MTKFYKKKYRRRGYRRRRFGIKRRLISKYKNKRFARHVRNVMYKAAESKISTM